jgi:hypothetical protein
VLSSSLSLCPGTNLQHLSVAPFWNEQVLAQYRPDRMANLKSVVEY